MKGCPPVFRMTLAAVMAAMVCLGGPSASAQNTSATAVAQPNPSNPSGIFLGPDSMAANATSYTPAPRAASVPGLPYGVGEVLKLYQGGIKKDVIIQYINNTVLPYHLGADGIVYLQSLGVPQDITKAIIQRDGQLQQQQQAMQQYSQQPMPPTTAPDGAVATPPPGQVGGPPTPPPSVTVVGGADYPYYGYGYPYYGYGWPYYYGGPVVIGGGWGWGWGYGGFRGGYGGFHGGFGGGHGGGHR